MAHFLHSLVNKIWYKSKKVSNQNLKKESIYHYQIAIKKHKMEYLNSFCFVKGVQYKTEHGLNYHFLNCESCLSFHMLNKKRKKIHIAVKTILIHYMIQIYL